MHALTWCDSNSVFSYHCGPYQKVKMLPKWDWVTLNKLRADVGNCRSSLARWGIINEAGCDFSATIQTMHKILEKYALTKYVKGLEDLYQKIVTARS